MSLIGALALYLMLKAPITSEDLASTGPLITRETAGLGDIRV
jgi:hypothetical protein